VLVPAGAALGHGSSASYVSAVHEALWIGAAVAAVGAVVAAKLIGTKAPALDALPTPAAEAIAEPPGGIASCAKLAALKQTSFQGTTLRGVLLEAYAFSKIGVVMLWGAIASFVLAGLMSITVGLGFWHAWRTESERASAARARQASRLGHAPCRSIP
jgi:hypothetical protein